MIPNKIEQGKITKILQEGINSEQLSSRPMENTKNNYGFIPQTEILI